MRCFPYDNKWLTHTLHANVLHSLKSFSQPTVSYLPLTLWQHFLFLIIIDENKQNVHSNETNKEESQERNRDVHSLPACTCTQQQTRCIGYTITNPKSFRIPHAHDERNNTTLSPCNRFSQLYRWTDRRIHHGCSNCCPQCQPGKIEVLALKRTIISELQ